MATVYIGSAHGDERGNAYGGQAGDQTGREVSTEVWYRHSKGWRVFRCKDPAKAKKIAWCMRAACNNKHIGYDQWQRGTLYAAAEPYGFDVSKVTKDVETDCSALVRVCMAYAGIMVGDFNTSTEPRILLNCGEFEELVGAEYTTKPDKLKEGDIAVTASKGHTIVVLNDGSASGSVVAPADEPKPRTLKNGMSGSDVRELQITLISLGYSCGRWGADGEFGDGTELAVRSFQREHNLEADGIVGAATRAALEKEIGKDESEEEDPDTVEFTGNCYIRSAPNTQGTIYGVALKGTQLPYAGEINNGWFKIKYGNRLAWVSSTYASLTKEGI